MRGLLGEALSERYRLTVADMEAGLEHLSRSDGTLRHVDVLLVVLEPYRKALETARRTVGLAAALGIPHVYGVANKLEDGDEERVAAFAVEIGLPLLATIPLDGAARQADRVGAALIDADEDAPSVAAVDRLLDSLEGVFAEGVATPA